MKPKSNSKKFKDLAKLDNKGRNFLKTFGELHPINDIDEATKQKIQIVKDEDDDSGEDVKNKNKHKKFKSLSSSKNGQYESNSKDIDLDAFNEDELVVPYQMLLTDLKSSSNPFDEFDDLKSNGKKKRKNNESNGKKANKKNRGVQDLENTKEEEIEEDDSDEQQETEDESSNSDENDSEEEDEESDVENEFKIEAVSTYDQEVLCKDNLESEDALKDDMFHMHFEKNLDSQLIEKLKENLNDRSKMSQLEQNIQMSSLGNVIYNPPLEEAKINLEQIKDLKQLCIKKRILERLNESIEKNLIIHDDQNDETSEYKLDKSQQEILNILSNYVDFYHANVDVKIDSKIKFSYAIHALNHILKTRSRIIAHNDKLKQNKSNLDIEYRDQGLTRPKVLIVVPYRKFALKLVKIFITLLMRKKEEYVSNKKRFYDSFGPLGDEETSDEEDGEEKNTKKPDLNNSEENKLNKSDDFNLLFSGNTDDHFRIGLSVSKKSLKLFTEFYSSDIIIASPLGLKSIIGSEGDKDRDYDFLSSIELLIIDNADLLMMQNWEHVLTMFDFMHLQPKKSHDTDFSRVRNWLLDGYAKYYRQTLVFSRIPVPAINNIFNKFCQNYAGKCQLDLLKLSKYQTGTICQIGFQLAQVFHRIECDSPIDLPNARFNFFIEKILPRFRDEMMSHTLIFIPSYFDFVKLRNYFKKNDISSMNLSEYSDNKSIDRSRYLFYHGKVHFMLLTERFHFYKRYKIRGINHIIFYELPHYAEYYSNFCNYMPDAKRFKNGMTTESFSSTVLYSKFDAQKLCAVVGRNRATHMMNSDKTVHMFMIEEN